MKNVVVVQFLCVRISVRRFSCSRSKSTRGIKTSDRCFIDLSCKFPLFNGLTWVSKRENKMYARKYLRTVNRITGNLMDLIICSIMKRGNRCLWFYWVFFILSCLFYLISKNQGCLFRLREFDSLFLFLAFSLSAFSFQRFLKNNDFLVAVK